MYAHLISHNVRIPYITQCTHTLYHTMYIYLISHNVRIPYITQCTHTLYHTMYVYLISHNVRIPYITQCTHTLYHTMYVYLLHESFAREQCYHETQCSGSESSQLLLTVGRYIEQCSGGSWQMTQLGGSCMEREYMQTLIYMYRTTKYVNKIY